MQVEEEVDPIVEAEVIKGADHPIMAILTEDKIGVIQEVEVEISIEEGF